MKNYVINLKHSGDRKKNVTKALMNLNIKPDFFDAIFGKTLTEDEIKQNVYHRNSLSVGEIGCAMSHLNIYKDMIEKEIEFAIIFEDDISINYDILTEQILKKLECFVNNFPENKPVVLNLFNTKFNQQFYKKIDDKISINKAIGGGYTAHAYIINLQAAKNILAIQTPLRFEIDIWKYYVYLSSINYFETSPLLVEQSGMQSEIWEGSSKKYDPESRMRKKNKKKNFYEYLFQQPIKIQIKFLQKKILNKVSMSCLDRLN